MGVISSKSRNQVLVASLILFVLECVDNTQAEINNDYDIPLTLNDIGSETDDTTTDPERPQQFSKENLDKASNLLAELLLMPWPKGGSPLVYVERPNSFSEYLENDPYQDYNVNANVIANYGNLRPASSKRSKYYRKYPWKRQQNNMRYQPAYMCIPNKDDVYRLLVAIHGERDRYKGQLVDFCNRKRPASLVFTNIRYVG